MTNKEFDKIFRDKLSGHRTPVDGGMWHSIEAGLHSAGSVPVGWWSKWRKAAGYAAGAVAAAAVIIAVILNTQENQTHLPIKTIDAGLPKLVAQSASAEPAEAQAPVLQPENLTAPSRSTAAAVTEAAITEAALTTAAVTEAVDASGFSASTVATEDVSAGAATAANSEKAAGSTSTAAEDASQKVNVKVAQAPAMAGLQQNEENCRGTKEKKMRSFSLFSNVAPRTDITAFSNHYGVMASSGISHSSSVLQSMEIISQAKHSLPLNLGVQVQFELGEKISAGVGLSYTWLRSRYEALINKKFHNVKQSLHYIGVPVNFYFTIMQNNTLKFYANVGGAVEKGLRASYHLKSYDGTSLSAKADIDGFQYSANFGLGLEYRFSNPCGIYLEPNAVYFFDSKVPASVRTDQPFQLKAEVGFRFHL